MAQAVTRQEQTTSKDGTTPEEAVQKEDASSIAGEASASASIADFSRAETPSCNGTDKEPAVRRWQELIGSSVALEEQARESDRWKMRQSASFLLCLSGVLWALLIVSALRLS